MKGVTALEAQHEILDAINELFVGTDERDWDRVRAVLAPQVRFDMKSMTGAEPATLSSSEIIAGWEEGLRLLDAVHHQTGNFRIRVDDDVAARMRSAMALRSTTGRTHPGGTRARSSGATTSTWSAREGAGGSTSSVSI